MVAADETDLVRPRPGSLSFSKRSTEGAPLRQAQAQLPPPLYATALVSLQAARTELPAFAKRTLFFQLTGTVIVLSSCTGSSQVSTPRYVCLSIPQSPPLENAQMRM